MVGPPLEGLISLCIAVLPFICVRTVIAAGPPDWPTAVELFSNPIDATVELGLQPRLLDSFAALTTPLRDIVQRNGGTSRRLTLRLSQEFQPPDQHGVFRVCCMGNHGLG